MSQPVTAILYAPGTNCHEETTAALGRAGLESRLVLLADLLAGTARLNAFQAVVIPGGFSYGDHLGAGRVFATMLTSCLRQELATLLASQKPLLGICNGFQVLAEAGILPCRALGERGMALLENQSAHFEDRFVRLRVSESESPWTRGLGGRVLAMPSAHGEGRPLFSPALRDMSQGEQQSAAHVALRYCDPDDTVTSRNFATPSGASNVIAGITDATGWVLGLMPHPERASLPAHASQDGLELFKNLARLID
ncbi:MAG: phosphoribosylformylglycinamidine synthase I [Terriglobia bacterium]